MSPVKNIKFLVQSKYLHAIRIKWSMIQKKKKNKIISITYLFVSFSSSRCSQNFMSFISENIYFMQK